MPILGSEYVSEELCANGDRGRFTEDEECFKAERLPQMLQRQFKPLLEVVQHLLLILGRPILVTYVKNKLMIYMSKI